MKETYFDFKKLDLNPRIISAAKQNGLLSSEGVLYGCSRHCQPGRQLPHADHRLLVAAVAALYCPPPITAQELLQQEQKAPATFSMGCPALDRAVGRVLRGGSVVEVCGESGVGKTQLALSVAVSAARPLNQGGRGAKVAYVCTEGQFPSSRLRQLTSSSSLGGDPGVQHDAIASNILVQHVEDLGALVACVEQQLEAVVARHRVEVVVVDSVAAPVRSAERLRWTDRQAALRRLGHGLRRLAASSSCLVLVLNQVSARIEKHTDLYGLGGACDVLPALGLAWSNLVTSRLLLHRTCSTPPLPGQEADCSVTFGEAPGNNTIPSSMSAQAASPSVEGNLSGYSYLGHTNTLQDTTGMLGHTSLKANLRGFSPSNPSQCQLRNDKSSPAHRECFNHGCGSGGRETQFSGNDEDSLQSSCVKRARVVLESVPSLAHQTDTSCCCVPRDLARGTTEGCTSEKKATANLGLLEPASCVASNTVCTSEKEATAGARVIHSTSSTDDPPPSLVRTLQVVACPWVPRCSVRFVVQQEGVRGVLS